MNESEIQQIIFEALEMANHARGEGEKIPVAEDTELYGSHGHLDSMGLVAFLIDIEESLLDQGVEVSLSDERAMSQSRSPFRNVKSLTDYILTLSRE